MSRLDSRPGLGRTAWTVFVTVYSLVFFQNLLHDALGDAGLIQRVFSALFVVWLGIEYYFGSPFFQSGLLAHSPLLRGLFACFVYPYIGYAGGDFVWWHWTQMPLPRALSGTVGLLVFAAGTGIRLLTLLEVIRMQRGRSAAGSRQTRDEVLPGGSTVRLRFQRMCRHPRYLATLVQLLGIAFVFRSWGALVLVIVIGFPLVLAQARYEDAVLRNLLGADFETHWQRVPLLLPRRR